MAHADKLASYSYRLAPPAAKVLRNTYLLLSATLLFSAGMAALAMHLHAAPINGWELFCGSLVLLFATLMTKESAWGLPLTFAFTGFWGYALGPLVGAYFAAGAGHAVYLSLGCTAAATVGLSAYAVISGRNFSSWGGLLVSALLVMIVASLANLFLHLPHLSLAIAAATAVLFCGYILYDTSAIVHGDETNYISATISLYLDILNLFLALMRLFGGPDVSLDDD